MVDRFAAWASFAAASASRMKHGSTSRSSATVSSTGAATLHRCNRRRCSSELRSPARAKQFNLLAAEIGCRIELNFGRRFATRQARTAPRVCGENMPCPPSQSVTRSPLAVGHAATLSIICPRSSVFGSVAKRMAKPANRGSMSAAALDIPCPAAARASAATRRTRQGLSRRLQDCIHVVKFGQHRGSHGASGFADIGCQHTQLFAGQFGGQQAQSADCRQPHRGILIGTSPVEQSERLVVFAAMPARSSAVARTSGSGAVAPPTFQLPAAAAIVDRLNRQAFRAAR